MVNWNITWKRDFYPVDPNPKCSDPVTASTMKELAEASKYDALIVVLEHDGQKWGDMVGFRHVERNDPVVETAISKLKDSLLARAGLSGT